MLKRVLVIANPVSGRGKGEFYANELAKMLHEYHHSQVELKLTEGEGDATNWASMSRVGRFDTVIGLGGDGTVNEIIKGLMRIDKNERPYFSFIPIGTVNDLARAIGLSLIPKRAIQQLQTIRTDALDIGQCNNDYFCNVLALGNIPTEVMHTDSDAKNRFGVLAYIRDGLQAFFSPQSYHLKLVIDEQETLQVKTNLLLLALTNSVAGNNLVFNHAQYNDGLLHIAMVVGHHPMDTINAVFELSLDNLQGNDLDNLMFLDAQSVTIEAVDTQAVVLNQDGDPGPALPVEVRIINHAIPLILPKSL